MTVRRPRPDLPPRSTRSRLRSRRIPPRRPRRRPLRRHRWERPPRLAHGTVVGAVARMTDGRPPVSSRRRRKNAVSSAVVAAATVSVTGLTLTWAVRTSEPATASFNTGAGAQTNRQIAADQKTIAQLQASIDATNQALGGLSGSPSATLPGATATTPGSTVPGQSPSSVAPTAGSGAGSVASSSPAAATHGAVTTSGSAAPGGVAPTPSPSPSGTAAPAAQPAPAAPPVTSPPPVVTTPPPTVVATTGASPAKP